MSASDITADYEQLEQIASKFGQTADEMDALRNTLMQQVDDLYTDGWRGEGSNKFFAEMEGDVLPAVRRLHDAFLEAQQVTLKTVAIFREAEQGASKLFEGGSTTNFDVGATLWGTAFGGLGTGIDYWMEKSSYFTSFGRNLVGSTAIGGLLDYVEGGITEGDWSADSLATQLVSAGGQALAIAGITAGAAALGIASAPAVGAALVGYGVGKMITGAGEAFLEHAANQTQNATLGRMAESLETANQWTDLDYWADQGAEITVDASVDIYEDASEAVKQYIY